MGQDLVYIFFFFLLKFLTKVQGAVSAAVIGSTLLGDRIAPVVKLSPGYGSFPTFCLLLLKTYKPQNNADQDFKG